MKKVIMICGMLFGMVVFAQAQDNQGRGAGNRMGGMMKPENRVKQLDTKLKLSDEQKAKLTTIFTEQAEAQKKMREEMQNGDRSAMREKFMKMRTENEEKINSVLTEQQKKDYKAMLEEQRANMQKRMSERKDNNN